MLKIRFVFLFILFSVLNTSFAQDQTVGLFTNDSRSFNGYTLFDPMRTETAFLIDNCGNTVNTWTSTLRPNLATYLLEDGSLLRACRITTAGGRLEKLDWDGNVIWSYEFDSQFFDMHHDIEPLPNGNILIISHDIYTPEEAILEGRDSTLLETELQSEKIVEIQPVGTDTINIVWEWKAWDHLIQDYDPLMNNYGVVADHPELFNINYYAALGAAAKTDWLHYNGIDYNPDLDQILLCSRNQSEIQVIDHSTTTAEAAGHTGGLYGKGGDILYRFGNPASYDRGTADDRLLFFQHDAQWAPQGYPDEGKMLVFNNQVSDTTSSVVILTPPMDSAGYYSNPGVSFYGPTVFDWVYESTEIMADNISGTQQLPNGNILICRGVEGNFFEVDKDGNLLWKYINPVGNIGPVSQGVVPAQSNVFKIRRYAPDFPGFDGIDLTPGAPVELDPWPSTCLVLEDTIAHFDLKVFLQGPFNGTYHG